MRESISKKTKEVIEKELREMNHIRSLMELTRIGARACPELDSGMMLQVALEEEIKASSSLSYTDKGDTGHYPSPLYAWSFYEKGKKGSG